MTDPHDRGSAAVEFVGVGVILTMCTLGILQTAVVAHVNAVLTDSAIAGAAYGALADSDLTAGALRARELSVAAVSAGLIDNVTAARSTMSGRGVVVVTIEYRMPLVGPWIPGALSRVTGRALVEGG